MKKQKNKKGIRSIRLGITQSIGLNKIMLLVANQNAKRGGLSYTLEVMGDSVYDDFVVRIPLDVYGERSVNIQYIDGEMFELECNDISMLLTGNEVIDYLKKLDLLR